MPLPPALAAKLAKRGIINTPQDPEPESAAGTEEEIIAEDYDDTPQQPPAAASIPHPHLAPYTPVAEPQIPTDPYQGYSGCPNKWNVYHECGASCREQWKDRNAVDPEYDRRRLRMLSKYPLPSHWQEVLDPGIGRYYYWNTETNLVSWLSPGHPRCQVSRSAGTLRKEMAAEVMKSRGGGPSLHRKNSSEEGNDVDEDVEMMRVENEDGNEMEDQDLSDKSEGSSDEGSHRDNKREERRERGGRGRDIKGKERSRGRGRDRERRGGGRRLPPGDDLDPMDPASYGECGRGTWSSGLPQRNEARTGADVTASGPLFQMRPYPSPGAVLKANAAATTIGPKKT